MRSFARSDGFKFIISSSRKLQAEVLRTMEYDTQWSFAIREGEEDKLYSNAEWEAIPMQQRQEKLVAANRQASDGFQYMFDYYSMLSAFHDKRNPDDFLNKMAEFIESEVFQDFCREITGFDDIQSADGQATRYRAGQYLTLHDDHFIKDRRCAYVMNFTQAWRADWGGLLLFHNQDGDIEEGWTPQFNCLNLFAVPQQHSVSFVSPSAAAYRYAITGWMLTTPPQQ